MPDDSDSGSDQRQWSRTFSANRGNIRYGTRNTASGPAAVGGPLQQWSRAFRRQGREVRNLFRGNNRNGSR